MASVNKDDLTRLYVTERKSIPDIAKQIGVGYSFARRMLLDAGIVLRSRTDGVRAAADKLGKHMIGKTRVFSEKWKENMAAARRKRAEESAAGVSNKTGGYAEITRGPNKGRGVHVVLMEQHIGRGLSADEVVHHIDGNKQNNSIDNLMLMTRSEHTRLHRAQSLKGNTDGIR